LTTYEVVFILDSKQVDDKGEGFAKQVVKQIEEMGGRVQRQNCLGRKQFARPIGKHRAGLYWDFIVDLDASKLVTFRERYKLNDMVLRLQAFRYERPRVAPKKDQKSGS